MKRNQFMLLAALITASAAGAGLKTRPQIGEAVSAIYDQVGQATKLVSGETSKLLSVPVATTEIENVQEVSLQPAVSFTTRAEGGRNGIYTRPPIYVNDINTPEKWSELTVLDANKDGQAWHHDNGQNARVWALDVPDIKMDDWLFTPYLDLEGGKTYQVKYKARCGMSKYPERMGVYAGTGPTAEAMTITVAEPYVLGEYGWHDYAHTFTVPTTGKYMIGYHGCSDPNTYTLMVDDIEVAEVIPTAAPNYVSDAMYKNNVSGDLSGTLSFKAPGVNLDSVALDKNLNVNVLRDGKLVKTFENVAPGVECSFIDNVGVLGSVEYTISGTNDAGEGPRLYLTAYIGVNKPKTPENVVMKEDGNTGKVTLTWDAVKYDISDFAIPEGQVSYDVYKLTADGWTPIKENLKETSFEYQAVVEGEQDLVQLGVWAKTVSGKCDEGGSSSMQFLGQPHTDFKESFADGELSHNLMFLPISGQLEAGLCTDKSINDMAACDGDNGYLYVGSSRGKGSAGLGFGKISLQGLTNPSLNFYAYNLVNPQDPTNKDLNKIDVLIYEIGKDGYEQRSLGTLDSLGNHKDGWFKIKVPLTNYKNKTIRFVIIASCETHVYNFFDGISVESNYDRDMSISHIEAPKVAPAGFNYDVDVTLYNEGATNASGHSVTLYVDGVQYEKKTCPQLASNAQQVVTFSVPMHTLREEPVKINALATLSRDGNANNNKSDTITVVPGLSRLAKITDLAFEGDMDGVKLNWTEPAYKDGVAEAVEEDFETAEEWTHAFGDWTFIDNDKLAVGGLDQLTIPSIIPDKTKASFFIWDCDRNYGATVNEKVKAHSGHLQLAALYCDEGSFTSDDWAVSPRLSGNAQTISFWAKSFDADWSEKISVLYSTGDDPTAINEFKETSVKSMSIPTAWKEIKVALPEGAKYFAVRSNHDENFILFLDDFKFERAYGYGATLKGYNVWLNDEKITADPIQATEYVEPKPGFGNIYKVTAVYDLGESAASNAVRLNIGLKNGKGTKENPYTISNVDELNFFFSMADKDACEGLYFLQTNDIDLKGEKMVLPLAKTQFQGNYDGANYALKNLNLVSGTETYAGMFANLGDKSVVKNLVLEGEANINKMFSAPLAGYCYGTVEGVVSKMNIVTSGTYTSGIASEVKEPAMFKDCEFSGKITSSSNLCGGIAGRTNRGTFINCKFKGEIANSSDTRANFNYLGGIAGYSYPSTFENCESDGKFPTDDLGLYRGGITGFCYGNPTSTTCGTFTFKNCVNRTKIKGASYLGGMSGYLAFLKYTSSNYKYKNYANVDSCVNYGDVYSSGTHSFSSGIIGSYTHSTNITDCDNYGNISSPNPVGMGGIVGGYMENPTDSTQSSFIRCRNYGKITALDPDNVSGYYLGGIVGELTTWTNIIQCENHNTVSGSWVVGGIAGYAYFNNLKVSGCVNYGDVKASYYCAAGIIGVNFNQTNEVRDCINYGAICSNSIQGGRTGLSGFGVGGISGDSSGTYENNLNAGSVTGAVYVGGIIGSAKSGFLKVSNCLNTGKVTGRVIRGDKVVTSLDSVGAIIGPKINGADENWSTENASQENNYYTPNTFGDYQEIPQSYLDSHAGLEIEDMELVNTNKLGKGWSAYDKYCFPLPDGALDSDFTKVWAAQVVPGNEADKLPKVTGDFFVGAPEGLTWTALPNVIAFSENNAEIAKDAKGEVTLTATCGEVSKEVKLTVDSASSVADIEADDVVEEAWYDLNGFRVVRPETYDGKVYVVVRLYSNGTSKATKVLNAK